MDIKFFHYKKETLENLSSEFSADFTFLQIYLMILRGKNNVNINVWLHINLKCTYVKTGLIPFSPI